MQPDTLIPSPSNPQAWNRYSYVGNRPINFNDPTGHESVCGRANSDPECGDLGNSPLSHPKPKTPLPQPKVYGPPAPKVYGPPAPAGYNNSPAIPSNVVSNLIWVGNGLVQVDGASQATVEQVGKYTIVSGPQGATSDLSLPAGRYLPENVLDSQINRLSKGGGAIALGASVIANLIDYGVGEHASKGIGSQEFFVSTTVDTALAYATGVAAAVAVGAFVAAVGITAAPVTILAMVVVVGFGMGLGLNALDAPQILKDDTNNFVDSLQGK